jgi:uncharacterized heparinase superfamily protein
MNRFKAGDIVTLVGYHMAQGANKVIIKRLNKNKTARVKWWHDGRGEFIEFTVCVDKLTK